MIVVDSSGWIEFNADGPHAKEFAARLRHAVLVTTDSGFHGVGGVTIFSKKTKP